jgi:conjugal transfer ATP-binding protein TraC
MKALCEELPYWEFESSPISHVILTDGSLASALEFQPMDIECYDEGRINQLTLGLRSFVNSLPEGLTCQILVKVENDLGDLLKSHTSLVTTKNDFLKNLDRERVEKIQDLISNDLVFRPRLYLTIKTSGAEKPRFASFSRSKDFAKSFAVGFDDRLQTLNQTLENVSASLSSLGFTSKTMNGTDLTDLIYKYLNPKRQTQTAAPVLKSTSAAAEPESPREQIVFGDLVHGQEDFILDSMRTRILTWKTLPEVTFAGMMSGFLSLPFKYELLFTFHAPDQNKEVRSLEQKRRMAHSLSSSASHKVSDLESESRLQQTTDLIREIIETGQKIFQVELAIVLREPHTKDGLRRLELHSKSVLSKFKALSGSEGCQETVGSWKIFKSNLPLAPMSLIRSKRLKTNNLVDFLPLYGAATGDEKPVCLMNTRGGTLYSFNPYDPRLSNYSMLVTGSSGSGKSFANNFLMAQQIARGVQVLIIDIGGSYKKMTESVGGQYFEINANSDIAINPFHLEDPTHLPSGDRLKSLVNIIELMVVDSGEKLTRFDRVQVEAALSQVFEASRNSRTPQSPTLSDFVAVCQSAEDESVRKIAKLLFPWVGQTPYGRMLDRQGRIQTDKPVVAFDLKGLSQYPDLQSVMILILTNFILEQVELNRSRPKRVLLDEAWELLKSPAASAFMEYAVRTFRKTGSGITFITQGVEEIISSGIGPAILNNTATKLIMLQRGDTQILKDTLKLNSQELKLIQSLEQRKGEYSEGLLMEGDSRQVIRIQPSPLEYWISTSDSRDNQYLTERQQDGHSLIEAIAIAAGVAPRGIAHLKAGS